MKKFILYSITNIVTNKMYIGVTSNYRHRIVTHLGYLRRQQHKNRHLQAAFNKHGEQSLVFDIIDDYDNRHDCYRAEKFMTDCVLGMDSSICMNMISGGLDISDKAREVYQNKIKTDPLQMQALKERSSKINKGRKWSEAYKEKMREATKGKKVSEETKEKLRLAHAGGKANGAKPVIDIKTGEIYGCMKDASKALGIKYCTMQSYLMGRTTNKTSIRWLSHITGNN